MSTYTGSATSPTSRAVRTIYFDGQSRRLSVASFGRVVKALKLLGLSDDEAKIAVLSIFDYASKDFQAKLVAKGVVTAEQVARSAW